jgi:hypothetical protein
MEGLARGAGGPPRPPCRGRPETTPSCSGQERGGERRGKSRAVSAAGVDQEGERKRSTDDVSRSALDDVETGLDETAWDESGGCLLMGQAVSGMEVARAWFGLWCGTWEPVVPRPRAASGAVVACGRSWKGGPQAADPRGASTDAGHRGGPTRSSDEGPVMGLERRGRVVLAWSMVNRGDVGGTG